MGLRCGFLFMLRSLKPFSGASVSSHQTRPCRNKHSLIVLLCDQSSQNQTCPSCTLMVPWNNMSLLKSKCFLDAVDVDNKCTTNVATVAINIHYTHTAYHTPFLVQLPNPIQSSNLMPQQHLEAAIIIPVINNSLKCHLWNFCFISILQILCKLSQMLKNLQRMQFVQRLWKELDRGWKLCEALGSRRRTPLCPEGAGCSHTCGSDTSICINVREHWALRGKWGLPLWLATYQLCVNFKMGL